MSAICLLVTKMLIVVTLMVHTRARARMGLQVMDIHATWLISALVALAIRKLLASQFPVLLYALAEMVGLGMGKLVKTSMSAILLLAACAPSVRTPTDLFYAFAAVGGQETDSTALTLMSASPAPVIYTPPVETCLALTVAVATPDLLVMEVIVLILMSAVPSRVILMQSAKTP